MATIYPLNYRSNSDYYWGVNPGSCTDMSYLMPAQDGSMCSVKVDGGAGFSLTGSDSLHAEVFTQTNATARLLVFRKQNIDEYTSGGVRTNRGTGYNASTTDWNATAWGNQIIACNYLDATQSSTGAGFSALGGGSPKARYIASNINFVMLADVDDSGSNVYSDMVWWSAIRNPNSWTPSIATQAGNIRLLDAPGPIKQIVAFKDKFYAFKENSFFEGTFVGPPYVFSWRPISFTIGMSYPKAITEVDGKLFWAHVSGVYSFDGGSVKNIGSSMWIPYESATSAIRMRGDDINGCVFLGVYNQVVSAFTQNQLYVYCYNCRTGQWSRIGLVCSSDPNANNPEPPMVYGTTAEYRAFNSLWGAFSGFAWIDNAASPKISLLMGASSASIPSTLDNQASVTTGIIGDNDDIGKTIMVYPRLMNGSTFFSPISSATMSMFTNEANSPDGTVSLGWNSGTLTLDGTATSRYRSVTITFASGKKIKLGGIGFMTLQSGKK